jgi:outer membrane protein assembly factor BamA
MSRTILPVLALAIAVSATASAQYTWTAKKIIFKNPGSFTQQQLESASGIHDGSLANAATLTAAAQKLSDTGYFDDISAHLDGTAANTTVVFELKPTPLNQMLRVGFENFVWLSPDEIMAALHAKLPLVISYLPEGSANADVFDAALSDALAAKGISAKIVHETIEPTLEHPERTIAFRVTNPDPVVTNVKLNGVSTNIVPLVQKSVNATAKTRYNAGLGGKLTIESILAPLLDAGYIKATLTNVKLEPGTPEFGMTPLVVSATVTAGDIYKVSTITFTGTPFYSTSDFTTSDKLHSGDVASRKVLLETLAPLDSVYRRLGYMDVIITANPAFDDATHQVAYTVTVVPGEPYHLHEVTSQNIDGKAKADFEKYFLLKPGDVYNPEYVTKFLKNNTAITSLAGMTGTYKATAYPATHTVDLLVGFFGGTFTVH